MEIEILKNDTRVINEEPIQEIKNLADLISSSENIKLCIPDYQRSYTWSKNHVIQLLEDIYNQMVVRKKNYRIGTLIFHHYEDKNNIVDGQQRIITMYLLLKNLGLNCYPLDKKFDAVSQIRIKKNSVLIRNWLSGLSTNESRELGHIITKQCEFVVITVYELSEAFQLFDSQNTRGKPLDPSDLLKAFHLQHMDDCKEEEKVLRAKLWEDLSDTLNDNFTINKLLSNHLFRIRMWTKGKDKYYFTNTDINEFKGVSLKQITYGFAKGLIMNQHLTEQMRSNPLTRNIDYPFSINQKIINGKYFFDYVFFFHKMYKELFSSEGNKAFVDFVKEYCYYPYSHRTGDRYIRNAYKNLLFLFRSNFDLESLPGYYEALYKTIYIKRLQGKNLGLARIFELKPLFQQIENAYSPHEFNTYKFKHYVLKDDNRNKAKGLEKIEGLIIGDKRSNETNE